MATERSAVSYDRQVCKLMAIFQCDSRTICSPLPLFEFLSRRFASVLRDWHSIPPFRLQQLVHLQNYTQKCRFLFQFNPSKIPPGSLDYQFITLNWLQSSVDYQNLPSKVFQVTLCVFRAYRASSSLLKLIRILVNWAKQICILPRLNHGGYHVPNMKHIVGGVMLTNCLQLAYGTIFHSITTQYAVVLCNQIVDMDSFNMSIQVPKLQCSHLRL